MLFLFSHRTLALLRWDLHFMNVRFKNFLFGKDKVIGQFLKSDGKKLLNLGSGPRGVDNPEWLNIDGYPDKNVQFLCDFNRDFPIPNQCLDGIFTEHVLEHFDYENGRKLLSTCFRILKSNGTIRIIVPDGKKILKAYFEEPAKILKYKECTTKYPIEAVNSWFYQRYEHQCIYDFEYMKGLLVEIGFSKVYEASYMVSESGNNDLLLDDPKYSWESLYVEAVK